MELALEKIKFKSTEEKPCQVKFSVQIPAEVVNTKQEEVTGTFQKAAHLPGFRSGKAPVLLIKQTFSEKIKREALEQLLQDAIPHILKAKAISPVTHPIIEQVQYDGKNALSFNLIIEYSPEFKVKNYTRIPVEKKIKKVGDADVERELAQLQEHNARLVPSKSEKAEKHHFAVIDYQGFLNGKALPELKSENQMINLAAPQTIQGFADGILGLSRGEHKEIPVEFPKEHPQKDLAGKSVIFNINLRDLKEKILPRLDDDFAKDFELSSMDALKAKILESLQKAVEKNSIAETEKQIHDYLVRENPIAVPDSLVRLQLEYLVNRLLARLEMSKEKLEEAKSQLRKKYTAQAEQQVRLSYLLNGIARQEKIEATPEELKTEMEKAQAANPEKAEELKKYFQEHVPTLLNQITEDKAMKFLMEHAKIKKVSE